MNDLHWKVSEITDNKDPNKPREVPNLTLELNGFQLKNSGYLRQNHIDCYTDDLPKHEKTARSTAAVARMVARCRQVFLPVWDKLSVLDYLVDKWNGAAPHSPSDFAARVSQKIGVVLNGLENQPIAEKSVFYLFPRSNNPDHRQWLTTMYQNLNRIIGGQGNQFASLDHTDPTTFTVMSSMDFVNYHQIRLWEAQANYLGKNRTLLPPPALSRPLLHVFKPEKEACEYDGDQRILDAKIVGLFDNEPSLELFLEGLMWGFIKIVSLEDNQGMIYVLELPPTEGEVDVYDIPVTEPYNEHLSDPTKYTGGLIPPMLEAAQTFCLREKAYNDQADNSTLQSKADFEDRLRIALKAAKEQAFRDSLEIWNSQPEGLTPEIRGVLSMPDSKKREEWIAHIVQKEKYREWCHAVQGES
ncbi:MAG: hypothetical protein ACNA8H_16870, partial [Anaerolineales bacterium]